MIEKYHLARSSELLDELNTFGIVLLLDLLIIRKACMFGRLLEVLEPSRVKRHCVLFTTKVLNGDLTFLATIVLFPFSSLRVGVNMKVRSRSVLRWDKVEEACGCGGRLC